MRNIRVCQGERKAQARFRQLTDELRLAMNCSRDACGWLRGRLLNTGMSFEPPQSLTRSRSCCQPPSSSHIWIMLVFRSVRRWWFRL